MHSTTVSAPPTYTHDAAWLLCPTFTHTCAKESTHTGAIAPLQRTTHWPAQLMLPPSSLRVLCCLQSQLYCRMPAARMQQTSCYQCWLIVLQRLGVNTCVLHLAEPQLLLQEGKAASVVARPQRLRHWQGHIQVLQHQNKGTGTVSMTATPPMVS